MTTTAHRRLRPSAGRLASPLVFLSLSLFRPLSTPPLHLKKLTFKKSWILPRSSWLSCVMNLESSRGQKALSCCWAEGESGESDDDDVGIAAAICCCSPRPGAARCLARTASRSDISGEEGGERVGGREGRRERGARGGGEIGSLAHSTEEQSRGSRGEQKKMKTRLKNEKSSGSR